MHDAISSGSTRIDTQLRAILASLPHDLDAVAQVCRGVEDWGAVFAAANEQGVAGVVLRGIERSGMALTRAASAEATRRTRPDVVWRDVLRHTLRAVLSALADDGVKAVSLKGPLLAARLYDDETLRPSTDIDVLVDPLCLDAAVNALSRLGYVLEEGHVGRFFRDHHHHVHLHHATLPVVELHFDAYRGFGTVLPAAPMIARSIPCAVPGWDQARVPAPEDEFIYLAVHAASHRFQRLVWLYDLKLLALRHPDLRWDHVALRTETHGFSAVVSFTCELLSAWLGAPRHGSAQLRHLGSARARAAEALARPRSNHFVNAAADLLFCTLLCDDPTQAAAFLRRFVRIKMLHEAPLRARSLFSI